MKPILNALFLLHIAFISNAQIVSIQEAVNLAIQNHPELKMADLQNQISENNIRKTESNFLPQINAVLDAKYNTQLQTSVIPANAFGGTGSGDRYVQFGTPFNTSFGISLKENIIDPNAISDRKISKQQLNTSLLSKEAIRIQIVENVMMLYVKSCLASQSCVLAREQLSNAQTQFDYQKNRLTQKQALETDLRKAEVDLENAQRQLESSRQDSALSIQNLAYQCGLDWGTSLRLSQSLEDLMREIAKPTTTSNTVNRIELKQEDLKNKIIQAQIRKTSFSYLPTLNLNANYTVQQFSRKYNPFDGDTWFPLSYVGFQVNIPIFDGLQRERNRSEFKLQRLISDVKMEQIRRQVTYEMESLSIQISQAESELKRSKANLDLARELYKVAEHRSQLGTLLPSELRQNAISVYESTYRHQQAQYQLLLLKINHLRVSSSL